MLHLIFNAIIIFLILWSLITTHWVLFTILTVILVTDLFIARFIVPRIANNVKKIYGPSPYSPINWGAHFERNRHKWNRN